MSKWKEFVERSKREYAEASPEGKRELKLLHSFVKRLFLSLILFLPFFFVPDDWKLCPLFAAGILFAACLLDGYEYNKIAKNKPSDENEPKEK